MASKFPSAGRERAADDRDVCGAVVCSYAQRPRRARHRTASAAYSQSRNDHAPFPATLAAVKRRCARRFRSYTPLSPHAAERREAGKLVIFCKLFRRDDDGYTRFGATVRGCFSLGHRGRLFFPVSLSASARHVRASDSRDSCVPLSAMQWWPPFSMRVSTIRRLLNCSTYASSGRKTWRAASRMWFISGAPLSPMSTTLGRVFRWRRAQAAKIDPTF